MAIGASTPCAASRKGISMRYTRSLPAMGPDGAPVAKPKMPLKRSEKSPKADGSKPGKPPKPAAPGEAPACPNWS